MPQHATASNFLSSCVCLPAPALLAQETFCLPHISPVCFYCLVMSQSSAPTTSSQQSTPSTPLSQSDGKILLRNGNVNLAHMHARLHYSPHPFVWRHHHSQTPRSLSTSHGQNQLNLSAAKKDDFPTLSSIADFFVRRPCSACHVERTFSLMGHIQTKDRLHMGNNTLRHFFFGYDVCQQTHYRRSGW